MHKLPNIYDCHIAIIGLGYVGLPLALQFEKCKKSYVDNKTLNRKIIGFDINKKRITQLRNGIDTTKEIDFNDRNYLNNISFTSKKDDLLMADIYIITVPTPINASNQPDFSYIINASSLVGEVLKKEDLILYP